MMEATLSETQKRIFKRVLFAHFFGICFLLIWAQPIFTKQRITKKIAVHTQKAATHGYTKQPVQSPPKEQTPQKTPPVKKTETSVKKTATSMPKPSSANKQKRLKQALAKINQSKSLEDQKTTLLHKASQTTHIPQVTLSSEGAWKALGESSYADILAEKLHAIIELPEKSPLTLLLELAKTGVVISVKVTKSTSRKNSQYVINRIQAIEFPSFDSHLKGKEKETFQIHLEAE